MRVGDLLIVFMCFQCTEVITKSHNHINLMDFIPTKVCRLSVMKMTENRIVSELCVVLLLVRRFVASISCVKVTTHPPIRF